MINETVNQIESMRTRSSSIVAVNAAEALRELVDRECHTVEDFLGTLEQNSSALRGANLSHAPLFTTQKRIVETVSEPEPATVEEAKSRLIEAIEDVVTEVETSKEQAAERAAGLIEDGDAVLTHAHSSTVVATLERAVADGKSFHLYTTESRPHMVGRKTARQFAGHEAVDVTLLVDGAVGHYVHDVDHLMVGMNCIIDDVVYNRIGTYPIVATAADAGVTVTIVGSSSKFIGEGFRFRNEFRADSEVLLEPAEGFDIGNPMYDETPTRLIDFVATEDAVIGF